MAFSDRLKDNNEMMQEFINQNLNDDFKPILFRMLDYDFET